MEFRVWKSSNSDEVREFLAGNHDIGAYALAYLNPRVSSTLGIDFCTLGQYVADPGVHWDTQRDTLGPRVGFSMIFDEVRDPL